MDLKKNGILLSGWIPWNCIVLTGNSLAIRNSEKTLGH